MQLKCRGRHTCSVYQVSSLLFYFEGITIICDVFFHTSCYSAFVVALISITCRLLSLLQRFRVSLSLFRQVSDLCFEFLDFTCSVGHVPASLWILFTCVGLLSLFGPLPVSPSLEAVCSFTLDLHVSPLSQVLCFFVHRNVTRCASQLTPFSPAADYVKAEDMMVKQQHNKLTIISFLNVHFSIFEALLYLWLKKPPPFYQRAALDEYVGNLSCKTSCFMFLPPLQSVSVTPLVGFCCNLERI